MSDAIYISEVEKTYIRKEIIFTLIASSNLPAEKMFERARQIEDYILNGKKINNEVE